MDRPDPAERLLIHEVYAVGAEDAAATRIRLETRKAVANRPARV
jgi:hypothetical protein